MTDEEALELQRDISDSRMEAIALWRLRDMAADFVAARAEVKALRGVLGDACNDDDRLHAARELGRREGEKAGRVQMRGKAEAACNKIDDAHLLDLRSCPSDAADYTLGRAHGARECAGAIAALPDEAPPAGAEGGAT